MGPGRSIKLAARCSRGRSARWPARRAPGSGASPLASRQHQLGGRDGHLDQRLADGGQRRPDPLRDRQVVEADDAQVLGDVQPRLAGGLVDAERLEVVAGEDRGRAVGQREQRAALGRSPPRRGTRRG